ncbi:tRNA guanylyltransferase [Tupanvirus deep ocean]|uniref:tRNA guanylyltransferase n=2 Tax=Tupanvirus TaxID=2094720 RepID=A0AC62A916_9VIRU|nr:tRNA guanylyltransferase [Tupanvirus deep ocean]QKU34259.1 tRNA guanylyltransferase [Tupanvirus deep ocean]
MSDATNIENNNQDHPSLGDRMKQYESVYDNIVPSDHYLCIRLDGHGFSKFTKNLSKPFDINFSKAMVLSAYDALCEFNARSAYTQSDEITLIFDIPDVSKGQTYIYNGRVQKLISLTASFVTTRFNKHLKEFVMEFVESNSEQNVYKQSMLEKINNGTAYFDARILSFNSDSKNEILNHLIWRSVHDCHRNAIQLYAYHIFGHKKIKNMNGKQMIELLKNDKNLSWENDVPLWQKYGVFIKKELVPIHTEHGDAFRSKIKAVSFKPFFSQDMLDFFLAVYFHQNKLDNVVFEPYNI